MQGGSSVCENFNINLFFSIFSAILSETCKDDNNIASKKCQGLRLENYSQNQKSIIYKLLLTIKVERCIYLTMIDLEHVLGAAGESTISQTGVGAEPPPGQRVIRTVLPELPKVPGWPTHTDDVVSDAQWEALGPELEAYQRESGEHMSRALGTRGIRSGDF